MSIYKVRLKKVSLSRKVLESHVYVFEGENTEKDWVIIWA